MEDILALVFSEKDNVATVFSNNAAEGTLIGVKNREGTIARIRAEEAVPYGHKIAVAPIRKGESIVKYGEVIGIAREDIKSGAYVHVHNLDSCRGRGDLQEREKEA